MSYQPKLLDELFASQEIKNGGGPLIAEVGTNGTNENEEGSKIKNDKGEGTYVPSSSSSSSSSTDEEGPSMMELMMQAQQEAQASKNKEKFEEEKKATKTFAGGFKKGFFGKGNGNDVNKKKTKSSSSPSLPPTPPPPPASSSLSSSSSSSSIPTITKKSNKNTGDKNNNDSSNKNRNLIMDEVQNAMKEDDKRNPMLAQLKQGDWVTPDLETQLKSNIIFQNGLKNPKCIQAMQLMQQDPKEAERRYKGDPEIDEFMREFGKMMSGHFSQLAERDEQQNETNKQVGSMKPVQEIGPLHAQALERGKQQKQSTTSPSSSSSSSSTTTTTSDSNVSDEQVNQIVNDPELKALLMDPKLQQILQECGDPVKFQVHMRNPETRKKIEKLYKSGLVGTTR